MLATRPSPSFRRILAMVLGLACLLIATLAHAQTTIATGSIQGTITDPSGAVVTGATVTIKNDSTGQEISRTTNSTGVYTSGALIPATYTVRVEMAGFAPMEQTMTVQVGVTTSGNFRLNVGQSDQVVQVMSSPVQVNTEEATIQGVLTTQQIDQLPVNGRNFLDLAQLEPGVQIQDGGNFDPTKNGFSSISIGGRFGRTARIEVDGLDISDETVGTTTMNIPAAGIQEFQISQSTMDLSTELTSSGSVNVVTHSGTNAYHGDLFYLFRDKRAGFANFPGGKDTPFQRNHGGGRIGGPIIKDRLFFMLSGERVKQDLFVPLTFAAPFNNAPPGFQSPFKDNQIMGKLDYQFRSGGILSHAHAFYRFTYNNNSDIRSSLPDFRAFANLDNTPSHAGGLDFTTGKFTHSFRAGSIKFTNHIGDAVTGNKAIFNPAPRVELRVGALRTGPNSLAPQATFQSNTQGKYDGSWILGSHIIRYGFNGDRIVGGGFASFQGLAPRVQSRLSLRNTAKKGPFPGGDTNPLNYPVTTIRIGNGQGFFTEIPEFDLPAGGQFDTRLQWYVGDSWKIKPNLTLTYGLRWVRDTGRSDHDLPPVPCSALDRSAFLGPVPDCPANGQLLDLFGDGLGRKVRQPNTNFAPQLGIAWDPFKNGKTVIRAGGGLYYENGVFNNVLFDRPGRLASGLFNNRFTLCSGGIGTLTFPGNKAVTSINGKDIRTQICGQPAGLVANDIADLQAQFQAAVRAAGPQANPTFVGRTLAEGGNSTGNTLFAPDYRTPRSWQANIGVQRELFHGTVLSADYVRNVSTRFLQSIDVNHVGDTRFLNKTAAINAIAATTGGFGCAGGASSGAINCAIAQGATIDDFAGNGLDSGRTFLNGFPASRFFKQGAAAGAAFGGINPSVGELDLLFPNGRGVYNALQVKLVQRLENPLPYTRSLNLQASYSLSSFESTVSGGDQDFINGAVDQRNPTRFFGPNGLDRRHQFSIGGTLETRGYRALEGVRLTFIGHFFSRLPQTLTLEDQSRAGEIFHTDVTGDGTTGDIFPGTNIGTFGRDISKQQLLDRIDTYNNTQAGTLTPAGVALVQAGLFTTAQLQSLGAVKDFIPLTAGGKTIPVQGLSELKTFDLKAGFPIKLNRLREGVVLEPTFAFFNIANFANFDLPGNVLSGVLNGQTGSIFGSNRTDHNQTRAGVGTGVFAQGAPRQVEFGLRLSF